MKIQNVDATLFLTTLIFQNQIVNLCICVVCLKSYNCEICKSDSSQLKPLNTFVDDDALAQM